MFSLIYSAAYDYDINVIVTDLNYPEINTFWLYNNFNIGITTTNARFLNNFSEIAIFLEMSRLHISFESQIIFYLTDDIYRMKIKEFVETQHELNPEQFL